MRNLAVILLISIFSLTVFAQTPDQTVAKKDSSRSSNENKVLGDEAEEYQKAVGQIYAAERIKALQKFVENFPLSKNRTRALELIVSARAELADEKLRLNELESGVELFKLAIIDAPTPISDKLFSEVILQILNNLFFRGYTDQALELARLIEGKVQGNPKQLLGVATFYLGIEDAEQAKRIGTEVTEIAPELPAAYQTLGLANRMNFDLQASVEAYTKALELDPSSVVSKRSLAEMKRATGKPEEAITLYREILQTAENDEASQTGLVLSLFDAGKREEAETEMTRALEQNPRNLFLLVGAAYWYAAHGEGAKAVTFAERAVTLEPRYTWAQIALARGLVREKRPLEAEKALLKAQQYGNFPTLDYEIASARLEAGLFREAADELKKSFSVDTKNGKILTYLGGRVFKEADNFTELLEAERRASIFEPTSAGTIETAEKLKSLLELNQELESSKGVDETRIAEAIDEFVAGDDNMKLHRQLFAANRLVEKKIALSKALELTEAATGGVDSALDIPTPSATVLADQLYETRKLALTRNELLVVPEISRQTLSRILRGRIEEITGWALYQQENKGEAITRLKRAVSVLPEKSAWWRSSMWRLGTALEGDGKEEEALDSYIKSYDKEDQKQGKRFVIEVLYRKLKGNLDGLDKLIGESPFTQTKADSDKIVSQNTEIKTVGRSMPTPTPKSKIPDRVPIAEIGQKETATDNIGTQKNTDVRSNSNRPIEDSANTDNSNKDTATENLSNLPVKSTSEDSTDIEPTPSPTPENSTDVQPTPSPTPETLTLKEDILLIGATPSPTPETDNKTNVEDPSKTVNLNSSDKKREVSVEDKLLQKQGEDLGIDAKSAEITRSIFEPIIINIPKKEKDADNNESDSKPTENTKKEKTESETKSDEKLPEKDNETDGMRPRIITENIENSEIPPPPEEKKPCLIDVSQESIALINDGGSMVVLVGLEEDEDMSQLKASTDSPEDIKIIFEPEIGGSSGQAIFIIKSISKKTGVYIVTFETPCGKKELSVNVR